MSCIGIALPLIGLLISRASSLMVFFVLLIEFSSSASILSVKNIAERINATKKDIPKVTKAQTMFIALSLSIYMVILAKPGPTRTNAFSKIMPAKAPPINPAVITL